MSSATAPATLSELRVDFREKIRDPSSSEINTIIDRYLNTALTEIHINNPLVLPYWAVRRGVIITRAPYEVGTVSITTATSRTAVTGASTVWTTTDSYGLANARAGGKIIFSGSTDVYEVQTVGGATSITLASQYTGGDLSAAEYTYYEDEYALASDFGKLVDLRIFSTDLNIPLIGPMKFRRSFPRNSTTGQPRYATFSQLGFSGTSAARPRVTFAPAPSGVYQIPYDYITTNYAVTSAGVEQAALVNDTDEPIMPLRYRQAIVYCAISHWYIFRKDDVRAADARTLYNEIMMRIAGDTHMGQDRPRFVARPRFSTGRGGGRFEVENEFDEITDR